MPPILLDADRTRGADPRFLPRDEAHKKAFQGAVAAQPPRNASQQIGIQTMAELHQILAKYRVVSPSGFATFSFSREDHRAIMDETRAADHLPSKRFGVTDAIWLEASRQRDGESIDAFIARRDRTLGKTFFVNVQSKARGLENIHHYKLDQAGQKFKDWKKLSASDSEKVVDHFRNISHADQMDLIDAKLAPNVTPEDIVAKLDKSMAKPKNQIPNARFLKTIRLGQKYILTKPSPHPETISDPAMRQIVSPESKEPLVRIEPYSDRLFESHFAPSNLDGRHDQYSAIAFPGKAMLSNDVRFKQPFGWDQYFSGVGALNQRERYDVVASILYAKMAFLVKLGLDPNGASTPLATRTQKPLDSILAHETIEKIAHLPQEKVKALLHAFGVNDPALMANPKAALCSILLPVFELSQHYHDRGLDVVLEEFSRNNREAHVSEGAVAIPVEVDGKMVPAIMYQYSDDNPFGRPRDEAWDLDLEAADICLRKRDSADIDVRKMGRPIHETLPQFGMIGANGEDFSGVRLFEDKDDISSVMVARLVPCCQNAMLSKGAEGLADAYRTLGFTDKADAADHKAASLKENILRLNWNEKLGIFTDYDLKTKKPTDRIFASGAYIPYFIDVDDDKAKSIARVIESQLLGDYGLKTTNGETSQQWDGSKGWACLHYLVSKSLNKTADLEYRPGQTCGQLAKTMDLRALDNIFAIYAKTGNFPEKIDVSKHGAEGGGGEYEAQKDFDWTRSYVEYCKEKYPSEFEGMKKQYNV